MGSIRWQTVIALTSILLLGILLGYVNRNSIIANVAKLKQPVQILATLLVQLSGLDESLVYRSNKTAVLSELHAFFEQQSRACVESDIVRTGGRNIMVAAGCQLPCSLKRPFGTFEIGSYLVAIWGCHIRIPSLLALR